MKKLISVLIACSLILISFCSVSANEHFLESKSITEIYNDGYINIESNTNDSTVSEADYGLQKASNLPEKYSSVDSGCITPIKNQQTSAACWAFATMSALEADVIKNFSGPNVDNTNYSPYHLAWFTYTAPKSTSDKHYGEYFNVSTDESPYSLGGNWTRAAATLANFRGIANSSSVPEDEVLDESLRYLTDSGYVIKDALALTTESEVKNWIINHGSCYVSYYHSGSYIDYSNGAYYYDGDSSANHAITIVGWDDNYDKSNFANLSASPKSNGAWLCKNSYGEAYTQIGGYMWVSYEDSSISFTDSFYGFSAQKDVYDNNYSYNNVSYNNYFTMNGEATFANVFTSTDDEIIRAVSFWTMNKNLTAKISIYSDIPDNASSPESENQLLNDYTVTLTNEGFHTISLNDIVSVEKGNKFSVVVSLTGTGEVYLPIERTTSKSTTNTGNQYESYFKSNGRWRESYSYNDKTFRNVFVSALTQKTANHNLVTDEKAATCTTDGYKKVYCKDCGLVILNTTYAKLNHSFTNYVYNNDATTEKDGTETAKCDRCTATNTRTKTGTKIVPNMNAKIKVATAKSVDYRSIVTIVATASGIDDGYHLEIVANGITYKGSQTEVNAEIGEIQKDISYQVRVVKDTGEIQDNLTKDGGKITCNNSFIKKLVAFFKDLFGSLPKVTIKP